MPVMRSWQRALELAQQLDARAEARRAQPTHLPFGVARAEQSTCAHDAIDVRKNVGGYPDDHETVYGQCRGCKAWVVSTLSLSTDAPAETRLMTDAERAELQREHDASERNEWLQDLQQAGAE